MTPSDTDLWHAIDEATAEFSGMYHYDHETGTEINIPGRDRAKYAKAYQYYSITFDTYINLSDILQELELIKYQVQHSQDFALQNNEFSTDFILNYSYKNWIIRVNIIAEQLVFLVNHIYRLGLANDNLINKIFEHPIVNEEKELYFALLNLVDFLHGKVLIEVNTQSIKRARNEIVHNANFEHNIISGLTRDLLLFKWGHKDKQDNEDLYLVEGVASEKIKNEMSGFSDQYLKMCLTLYAILARGFEKNFKLLTK
jgi:hypothetical protein